MLLVGIRCDNRRAHRDGTPRKTIMSIRYFSPPAFLAVALLITGCATPTKDKDGAGASVRGRAMQISTLITTPADAREGAGEEAKIFKGSGQLVKGQLAGGGLPAGSP